MAKIKPAFIPAPIAKNDLNALGKSIETVEESLGRSAFELKNARNEIEGLADRFSDNSGKIEKGMNSVGKELAPALAHYKQVIKLLQQAEAEMKKIPALENWDATLGQAKFAIDVLGRDTETIQYGLGGEALADVMGAKQAALIFKASAAKNLLEELAEIKKIPLWQYFDSEKVDALCPQLQTYVDAAKPLANGFQELLANRIAVSDLFSSLEIPAFMRGLTLKPFLEKAAEEVTKPEQKLVDRYFPVLPNLIKQVAKAVDKNPVDWSDCLGILETRGDGLLQKVICAIKSGASKLAPDMLIV